jgi:hypothetical protein
LAVFLAACSRSSSSTSDPSSSSGPAASASLSGFTAPAASSPSPVDVGAPQILARVNAWNDALDSHNVAGLTGVYFEHVCYYGRVIAVDKVLKQKKDALGSGSSFRQQLVGAVRAVSAQDGFMVARFMKRSGPAERLRDTPARIVLRQDTETHELRILEEADDNDAGSASSDACAQEAWSAVLQGRCEDAASRAVNAMPRVKQIVNELLEASTDDHALGGMGPNDNGDGTFSASIGVHTPDRFEGRVDYTVDRRTGHLTISIDDTQVAVPEGVQHELANACKP